MGWVCLEGLGGGGGAHLKAPAILRVDLVTLRRWRPAGRAQREAPPDVSKELVVPPRPGQLSRSDPGSLYLWADRESISKEGAQWDGVGRGTDTPHPVVEGHVEGKFRAPSRPQPSLTLRRTVTSWAPGSLP